MYSSLQIGFDRIPHQVSSGQEFFEGGNGSLNAYKWLGVIEENSIPVHRKLRVFCSIGCNHHLENLMVLPDPFVF
jgi:hypothetical protein